MVLMYLLKISFCCQLLSCDRVTHPKRNKARGHAGSGQPVATTAVPKITGLMKRHMKWNIFGQPWNWQRLLPHCFSVKSSVTEFISPWHVGMQLSRGLGQTKFDYHLHVIWLSTFEYHISCRHPWCALFWRHRCSPFVLSNPGCLTIVWLKYYSRYCTQHSALIYSISSLTVTPSGKGEKWQCNCNKVSL